MNARTILDVIATEKDIFLTKHEDKEYFKKKSSVFFTDFLSRGDKMGAPGSIFATMFSLSVCFGSLFLSANIAKQMETLFHLNTILVPIFAVPFTILLTLAALKIAVSSVLKWKYKRRKNNDFIAELFTDDFYSEEVSPEIKNMLKLLLSEDKYFELREGKAHITYKDAKAALDSIVERESVMKEKQEVSLSPEEIKKYSHVNAG